MTNGVIVLKLVNHAKTTLGEYTENISTSLPHMVSWPFTNWHWVAKV